MDILPGFKLCRKGLHQYPEKQRRCPDCHKKTQRKWREKNKNKILELNRKWKRQNSKTLSVYNRKWEKENPEKTRKIKQKWRQENKEKRSAEAAARRALKKQALPPWANIKKIKEIYKECFRLSMETGIKHHVDHIYPLQSKYMCGLHVETNLQVIKADENIAKGNRTWPGQLPCQRE